MRQKSSHKIPASRINTKLSSKYDGPTSFDLQDLSQNGFLSLKEKSPRDI